MKRMFAVVLLSVWCAMLNGQASNCGEIKNDLLDLIKELQDVIGQQKVTIGKLQNEIPALKHEVGQQQVIIDKLQNEVPALKHEIVQQQAIIGEHSRDIEIMKTTRSCCSSLIGRFKKYPAKSCKWLRENLEYVKSGMFWVSLKNPTKVFCDMEKENDGGGWTMVGQAEARTDSEGEQITCEKLLSNNISDISNVETKNYFLSGTGLRELQTYINFTQIRLYCHKPYHGRTVHIYTSKNDLGTRVVDLMTGKLNEKPKSCNSYLRMRDDSSNIGLHCESWKDQKWYGWGDVNARMYRVPLYEGKDKYFGLYIVDYNLCDDNKGQDGFNNIGRWSFYVR